MSLSAAINEHNAWFHSRQDEYYSWFLDGGHEAMSMMLSDLSGRSQDASIEVPLHSKYILDNDDYSFLLVGMNGEAGKLSPAFELSDENTNVGENEAIPSHVINAGAGMEVVRYIAANSSYEFPLRDEQNDETIINDLFLVAVDELYESFLTQQLYGTGEAGEDEELVTDINKTSRELMMANLAKKMVFAYYNVPWSEIAKECGGMKEAYEWFVQETYPGFTEDAFNQAKEDLLAMFNDDDSESE